MDYLDVFICHNVLFFFFSDIKWTKFILIFILGILDIKWPFKVHKPLNKTDQDIFLT